MTLHPLPWWRRIGLAFVVFFRVVFDERYARSMALMNTADTHGSPNSAQAPGTERNDSLEVVPVARNASNDSADRGALVLLGLLQSEGRFVDFVQQDITAFEDSEIGAVARVVHGGCRKVIGAHLRIEAIRAEPEGQQVALEPGFDPNRIKLTGKVGGGGRLQGILRHRGWQAADVRLPTAVDAAAALVLCPAEVEL